MSRHHNITTTHSTMSSSSSKRSFPPPPGHAVRILSTPFPFANPVVETTVTLPESGGKLGVRFRWNGRKSDCVYITTMEDDSMIKTSTSIQPNDIVLAVNGVPALKSSQVGQLIKNSTTNRITLTTLPSALNTAASTVLPPFCQVFAAPTCAQYTLLNVDSTRGRCLCQVSRLFFTDADSSSNHNGLAPGDIILSINGVPVSKPQMADRLLLTMNEQQQPYVWVYSVNMKAYRASIATELRNAFPAIGYNDDTDTLTMAHETWDLTVNHETQHVHLQKQRKWGRHTAILKKYVDTFNKGMEDRMRLLEEVVCCEAFKYQQNQQSLPFQHPMTTPARPSSFLPVEEDDESSACSSTGSSHGSSCVEASPPLASAIVLPLSALQTRQERENYASTLAILGN